jgi:hypothetical protein
MWVAKANHDFCGFAVLGQSRSRLGTAAVMGYRAGAAPHLREEVELGWSFIVQRVRGGLLKGRDLAFNRDRLFLP